LEIRDASIKALSEILTSQEVLAFLSTLPSWLEEFGAEHSPAIKTLLEVFDKASPAQPETIPVSQHTQENKAEEK
jgi:hypothetical protein